MTTSLRQWSKGSARNAGPQKPKGVVHVRYTRAADTVQCRHGVPARRCDDCGEWVPSHPGAVMHVCGEDRRSCMPLGVTP